MSTVGLESIWDELERSPRPEGEAPDAWCYDLLLGAAFSLSRAASFEPTPPDAYIAYRNPRELRRMTGDAYAAFAWGFYLNSAIHRVVWAVERLLRLRTGMDAPSDRFPAVIAKAKATCTVDTPALAAIISHFSATRMDHRRVIATPTNVLHVLYDRVNRQKHWGARTSGVPFRGFTSDEEALWGRLSGARQVQLVEHALHLVIALYSEGRPGTDARGTLV